MKQIIRGIGFCAILLVLLLGLSFVMEPKDNTQQAGMERYEIYGLLGEPANTIDVVAVGNSLCQCSVSAMDLWQAEGITGYTCAMGNQTMHQCLDYARMAFENQSPKVVLLEAQAIYYAVPKTDIAGYYMESLLPVLRYHNRWKHLTSADFTQHPQYTHREIPKGVRLSRETMPIGNEAYMISSEDTEKIPWENALFVKQMRKLCRENGARLIVFSAPSRKNWNYACHNGIAALAREQDLEYWDLNLETEEIGIDWLSDTMDGGDHLNSAGAAKMSAHLAGKLAQTGLFEDKRQNADYEDWNRNLSAYASALKDCG